MLTLKPVPRPGPDGMGEPDAPPYDDGTQAAEGDEGGGDEVAAKIVVKLADGKERAIRYIASTSYWSSEGRPISGVEFLKRLFGDLSQMIPDEDSLRNAWSDPDNREAFLGQLLDLGYDDERLDDMRQLIDAKDSDLFDVLAYILFTNPPVTRATRATVTEAKGLKEFDGELQALLVAILRAYVVNGERELGVKKLGQYLIARYGSVAEGRAQLALGLKLEVTNDKNWLCPR